MLGFRGGGWDVAATKPALAWRLGFRNLELGFRSLNFMEVDARKPAFDVNEIRSLDSKAWMRGGCDEAGVEVGCDQNSKLGFRSLDARWMRRSLRGGWM